MDITTISSALSSIKTATEIAKLIKNSDNSIEQAEAKLKLAELISTLAEAKIEIAEIQQMLFEKDAEIYKLKLQISEKESFCWESPYYWRIEGDRKDGPFCQHCYDKYNEKIRLQGNANGNGWWECAACKNVFTDKSYHAPRLTRDRLNSF